MTKLAAIVLATILLSGCDASSVSTTIDPAKITYTIDSRTKLCFAVLGRGTAGMAVKADSFSMTNVPCSAEVLALVVRR